jgi:hypothetical protein
MRPAATPTERCARAMLVLLALLGVLAVSRDMPAASASGLGLLPLKVRWAVGWVGFRTGPPFTPVAAEVLARSDHRLATATGRQAAAWLAGHGSHGQRLRWSVALTRIDREHLPLVVGAVRHALGTRDCGLLRAAALAARGLSARDRRRVAREFADPRFAHWGTRAVRAGLTVADCPELRRGLRRAQRAPAREVVRCPGDAR